MLKNKRKEEEKQAKSKGLEKQLLKMLRPVLRELKQRLDRRLVKTFLGLVLAIVMHPHRNNGLLLSELGGYLLGAEQCQAGTKRISKLVHSEKWEARVIEDFLWQQGTQRVEEIWEQGEHPLVRWDESVLEKPESLQAERLCAVRSTKAVRLKRSKPGFFNPPGGRPVFVPGFHWLQLLVVDHARRAGEPETNGGKPGVDSHRWCMGQRSVTRLGSWFCWQPLADPSLSAWRSFCPTLTQELLLA